MPTQVVSPVVVRSVLEVRARVAAARARGGRTVLVPTMGALHEGHRALVLAAREQAGPSGCVVVSIFVNPTQFGPTEDLASYPRDLAGDVALCASAGADVVFAPDVTELYPEGHQTVVDVAGLAAPLCGATRPGHFRGVATVVTMLFGAVRPDAAVFGQKDYQQLQIIRRLARDLHTGVTIVSHPTVREPDGLAMSSRNRYLTAAERAQAPALHHALTAAQTAFGDGERRPAALVAAATGVLARADLARPDYVEILDADSLAALAPVEPCDRPMVLAMAVRLGRARLIDNTVLGRRDG